MNFSFWNARTFRFADYTGNDFSRPLPYLVQHFVGYDGRRTRRWHVFAKPRWGLWLFDWHIGMPHPTDWPSGLFAGVSENEKNARIKQFGSLSVRVPQAWLQRLWHNTNLYSVISVIQRSVATEYLLSSLYIRRMVAIELAKLKSNNKIQCWNIL